jgi:hypothetical protein
MGFTGISECDGEFDRGECLSAVARPTKSTFLGQNRPLEMAGSRYDVLYEVPYEVVQEVLHEVLKEGFAVGAQRDL